MTTEAARPIICIKDYFFDNLIKIDLACIFDLLYYSGSDSAITVSKEDFSEGRQVMVTV